MQQTRNAEEVEKVDDNAIHSAGPVLWKCAEGHENDPGNVQCVCGKSRPAGTQPSVHEDQKMNIDGGSIMGRGWECGVCTMINEANQSCCGVCASPRSHNDGKGGGDDSDGRAAEDSTKQVEDSTKQDDARVAQELAANEEKARAEAMQRGGGRKKDAGITAMNGLPPTVQVPAGVSPGMRVASAPVHGARPVPELERSSSAGEEKKEDSDAPQQDAALEAPLPCPWTVAHVTAPGSTVTDSELADCVLTYSKSVQVFRERYRLPDNKAALVDRGRPRLNEYWLTHGSPRSSMSQPGQICELLFV